MKLWLGRHAQAVDPEMARSDHDRVLSDFGRRQISQLATWLMSREEHPQLILHSPLIRARQTAEAIAAEVPAGVVVLEESLLAPGFSTPLLLRRLEDSGIERIVCIGHQPDIGRCLAELTGGVRAMISPGTIAGIDFYDAAVNGTGALRWLADPAWFEG